MFCNELKKDQKNIRVLQRKLERQRRANNPQNFNENGTVKKGANKWVKSSQYKDTQKKLFETSRIMAEYRKSLHGQLVNHNFSMGNEVKLEKLSYRAFQKMFGKSVGMRAPGLFVTHAQTQGCECWRLCDRIPDPHDQTQSGVPVRSGEDEAAV